MVVNNKSNLLVGLHLHHQNIHHQVLKEFNGCKIESFNTLAPSDAWAAAHAYFAAREMHSMVFNKEYGLVARNVCPVGLAHS